MSEKARALPELNYSAESLVIFIGSLAYFWLLQANIGLFLFDLYAYEGFLAEPSLLKNVIAHAVIIVAVLANLSGPRSRYLQLLIALILIPSCALYAMSGWSHINFFVTVGAVVLVDGVSRLSIPVVEASNVRSSIAGNVLLLASLFYIAVVIAHGGLVYLNFDFRKVYEVRGDAASILPLYAVYLGAFVTKVALPIYIAMSVINKNWLRVIVGACASVFIFALTSHKSPMVYPLLVLGIYYASSRWFGVKMIAGLSAIAVISLFDLYMASMSSWVPWFAGLLLVRAIFIPSIMNGHYIDFFLQNPFYWWSESKFSFGLVNGTYDLRMEKLIGDVYYNNPDMSANAGWIGSGFAQAGVAGIMLYSILLGLLIAYLVSQGQRIGQRFVLSATAISVLTLYVSTDFSTSLFSNGLVFLVLLLPFFPVMNKKKAPHKISRGV